MADEVLDLLDEILENGDSIPSRVSNRLLLAAIRKNYRLSRGNCTKLEAMVPQMDVLGRYEEEHHDRLQTLEDEKERIDKWLVGIFIGMAVLMAAVSWHTGIDFGWWPGF